MKSLFFTVALAIVSATPGLSDTCRDKIDAMFDGGPLDPFVRAPHRLTNTETDANGQFLRRYLTKWQTPSRTVSGIEGGGLFALIIGQDSWTGPSLDGPWTKAPNMLPMDHDTFQRMQQAQMRANLSDTACPGMTEIDGAPFDTVSYVTKTDPTPESHNAWFGARHTVYIHPDTQQVMRWEMTDFVSSFAPDLSKNVQVQIYDYDPDLTIDVPN